MIPKIAHFHWEGPMNWMRWATLLTFEKFHPDYEIRVIRTPADISSQCDLPHHRGDWSIYRALRDTGGWAIDTDIVFVGRIPDEWLDSEMSACQAGHGHVYNIAALGAAPGCKFFDLCDRECADIVAANTLDYQSLGAGLLINIDIPAYNCDQPIDAFCPVKWFDTAKLWQETPVPLPDCTVGVHWYGGHETSKKHENEPPADAFIVRLAKEILDGSSSLQHVESRMAP